MKSLEDMKGMNLNKVVKAIEADAGEALPGLREALAEAKAGQIGAVHTPAQIVARKRGRPAGSVKQDAKVSTTIWLLRGGGTPPLPCTADATTNRNCFRSTGLVR